MNSFNIFDAVLDFACTLSFTGGSQIPQTQFYGPFFLLKKLECYVLSYEKKPFPEKYYELFIQANIVLIYMPIL